jgi:uncharacterized protein YxeA
MTLFWKQYRNTIAILALLLVFFLLAWYVIRPLHAQIEQEKNAIQEALATKEIKEDLRSKIPEFREQSQKVLASREVLNIVIHKDDIVALIREVEALANETGTEVIIEAQKGEQLIHSKEDAKKKNASASAKNEKNKEDSQKLTLESSLPSDHYLEIGIKLTGGYDRIVWFIEKLETMRYATDILSLDIVLQPDSGTAQSVSSKNLFTDLPAPEASEETSELAQSPSVKFQANLRTIVYIQEE